jgi:hypothetical protein
MIGQFCTGGCLTRPLQSNKHDDIGFSFLWLMGFDTWIYKLGGERERVTINLYKSSSHINVKSFFLFKFESHLSYVISEVSVLREVTLYSDHVY